MNIYHMFNMCSITDRNRWPLGKFSQGCQTVKMVTLLKKAKSVYVYIDILVYHSLDLPCI